MKYVLQTLFAFLGGIILLIVNAVGDPGIYAQIVAYLKFRGYISPENAQTIIDVLYYLAYLGGGSVIIGALFYLVDKMRPATFFISIGAGISATMIAMRAIALGSKLREALLQGGIEEFMSELLGVNLGLRMLGTLLALLALLTYYVPIILGTIAGIAYLAAGSTMIFEVQYVPSLSLMGIAIFVVGIVGSMGYVKLYRTLSALLLIAYVPAFVSRLFGGFFDYRTLSFAIIGMLVNVIMIVRRPEITVKVANKLTRSRSFLRCTSSALKELLIQPEWGPSR